MGGSAPREADSYATHGRSSQKARTRTALVTALRALMAEGRSPGVEDVAAAAGVSRTTAYRYFPDREALLRAAIPQTAAVSLLGEDPPDDVLERVEMVVAGQVRILHEWEPQARAALWASLSPGAEQPHLRGGRAITWFEDALSPLVESHSREFVHDLAIRLRAAVGIEPWVWLRDVAGLSRRGAGDVLRRNARAVVRESLSGAEDDHVRGS